MHISYYNFTLVLVVKYSNYSFTLENSEVSKKVSSSSFTRAVVVNNNKNYELESIGDFIYQDLLLFVE